MKANFTDGIAFIVRLGLGGLFVFVGVQKVLEPVAFLKAIHGYQIVPWPVALNVAAVVLPGIEIVCGLMLLTGVMLRGAALLQLALLIGFTTAITLRGIAVARATGQSFCAVHFDCGCGTGDLPICWKLIENTVLIVLARWLASDRNKGGPDSSATSPRVPPDRRK